MKIEVKISQKPIKYTYAINYLEKRIQSVLKHKKKELIWILEHRSVYTGGTSYKENEILDKSINLIKTNRGGKITWHGPGQMVCYFVIDLNKRKKDIRKFISIIENSIIKTLNSFKINSFRDPKNIGIWVKKDKKIKKVAAIGIRIKKWVAYHGFSLNITNDLKKYDKIIPCGIINKDITNLNLIKKQNYLGIKKRISENLIKNLETLIF